MLHGMSSCGSFCTRLALGGSPNEFYFWIGGNSLMVDLLRDLARGLLCTVPVPLVTNPILERFIYIDIQDTYSKK